MNLFLFSALALCLVAGAHGSYQSAQGYGNQRKMAPSPQTYGSSPASSYGQQQQQQQAQYGDSPSAYEQPQQQQQATYSAPANYGAQAQQQQQQSGYAKPQMAAASYSRPAAAPASYGQQQPSYAKAAPKYEEPQHPPMPFAWGYDINDGYGGAQFHKETGDEYGKRTGSYGYTDAYGIYRQVDYVADEHGFRATIKTNEPGTANESPADVELHAYEPPSNYYAGNRDSSSSAYSSPAKSAPAPAPASYAPAPASYGASSAPAASYGQQQASYSAPRAPQPSYSAQASAPSRPSGAYARPAAYAAARAPQSAASYDSSAQYSSSAIVPVYHKAPGAGSAPVRRAY